MAPRSPNRRPPAWRSRLTALALGVTAAVPSGCHRYIWPAAHITESHEQYWSHKIAEVDSEATMVPPPRREEIFGPGPQVRDDLDLDAPGAELTEAGLPQGSPIPGSRLNDELLEMTLFTAIRIALQNNTVIRQDTQFLSTSNPLLGTIDTTASVFDPQIQDTNVLFGSRGVGAAMADFVPTLSGNLLWGRDETVLNQFGLPTAQDSTTDFDLALTKQLHTGGSLTLSHNVDFLSSDGRGLGRDGAFSGSVGATFTYPLWAASGTEFTQIAGPADFLVPRVTSVNQGVLISRINSDLSRLDLELNVRQLVRDVVNAYWDLTLAFGQYEAEEAALEATEALFKQQKAKIDTGQASRAEIAQAAETYLSSKARKQEAVRSIDENEQRLRRLLGLPVSDGRLIRPADDAELQELPSNWNGIVLSALQKRPQLKRTRFNLRSLQLQLKAARKLVAPRLDFISAYRQNAFGDELAGQGGSSPFNDFYGTLGGGELEGWTLGFNFSTSLNFQLERSQVNNLELRIAKNRVQLAAQEAEISHEIAVALQNAQNQTEIAEVQAERLDAAQVLVDALRAEYEAGRPTLDRLVRAEATLAQAKIDYRRSLVEFSRANSELLFRRSLLLESSGVQLQFPDLLTACEYDYCDRVTVADTWAGPDATIKYGHSAISLQPPQVFRIVNPNPTMGAGLDAPGFGPSSLPERLPLGDLIDLTDPDRPNASSGDGSKSTIPDLPEPPPRREGTDDDGDGSLFDFTPEATPEGGGLPEPPPRRDPETLFPAPKPQAPPTPKEFDRFRPGEPPGLRT